MDTAIERHLLKRPNPLGRGQSIVAPDYGSYCIASIPELIGSLLGVGKAGDHWKALQDRFAGIERIVFLLLDGFGYRKAQEMFSAFPNAALKELADRGYGHALTSVYPSTTVAALTSLSTGLTPAEHGMIGYRLYLRETATITNMIRFSTVGNPKPESVFSLGLDRAALFPKRTIHQQLVSEGISVHSILPGHIANSGLSNALYRGCAKQHAAVSLPDMFARTREILNTTTGKTFVSLYWPGLDSVAHVVGPNSPSYRDEFLAIDDAVRRGLIGGAEDTLLIVTADHGFVPMAPEDYILLDGAFDAGNALVMPPVGEPRASYLFTRNGGRDLVRRAFATPRDDGLVCLESEELLESHLLGIGTPHPEVVHRIGDMALLSTGRAGTFQDYPDAAVLRGMHGGLTEHEMLVPLIASTL